MRGCRVTEFQEVTHGWILALQYNPFIKQYYWLCATSLQADPRSREVTATLLYFFFCIKFTAKLKHNSWDELRSLNTYTTNLVCKGQILCYLLLQNHVTKLTKTLTRKGGNSCRVISKDNNHTLLPDTQAAAIRYNTPALSKACKFYKYGVNINSRDTSLQRSPVVLCPPLKTPPASTPSIPPHSTALLTTIPRCCHRTISSLSSAAPQDTTLLI